MVTVFWSFVKMGVIDELRQLPPLVGVVADCRMKPVADLHPGGHGVLVR